MSADLPLRRLTLQDPGGKVAEGRDLVSTHHFYCPSRDSPEVETGPPPELPKVYGFKVWYSSSVFPRNKGKRKFCGSLYVRGFGRISVQFLLCLVRRDNLVSVGSDYDVSGHSPTATQCSKKIYRLL